MYIKYFINPNTGRICRSFMPSISKAFLEKGYVELTWKEFDLIQLVLSNQFNSEFALKREN